MEHRWLAALVVALGSAACGDPTPSTEGGRDVGTPDALRDDARDDTRGGTGDAVGDDADGSGDAAGDAPSADDGSGEGDDANDGSGGDGDASDAGDAADVAADAADTTADDADAADAPPPCEVGPALFTGVATVDRNGDPLEVGDAIDVTIFVEGVAGAGDITLTVNAENLGVDLASVERDGAALAGVVRSGSRLTMSVPASAAEITFEATVTSDRELAMVFSELATEGGRCPLDRSRAASILQVLGGESKTPTCVDLRRFRSVQVAPAVPSRSTRVYRDENGQRTDLVADDFIFCPQSPTIVHAAEFCLERDPSQRVTLAGTHDGGGVWEVDDFMLIEVFEGGRRLADGFTSQRHPGGDTFWCGETSQNLCRGGCTASLTEVGADRALTPLAVSASFGDGTLGPREFRDGAVDISALLPADGRRADVRITALDQGEQGNLLPGLYLLGGE